MQSFDLEEENSEHDSIILTLLVLVHAHALSIPYVWLCSFGTLS